MEDIEVVKCECCGLKEECTKDYICEVKAKFDAKWLCGLCCEAVGDEIVRSKNQSQRQSLNQNHLLLLPPNSGIIQDAVKAHMLFCRSKFKSNPAVRVADAMKQILRRRSTDLSSHSPSPTSSSSTSQLRDMSSFSNSFR